MYQNPQGQRSDWCCLNASSSCKKKCVNCHLSNISAGGSASLVPLRSSCFGFSKVPKKKTLSAAPSACSLPELLPKIAASTITAEEALAALFEPTAALWQGTAPPLVHSCCSATRSHLSSAWFGKYSSVSSLIPAFILVCFLQHLFCLTSCSNSSGLVLIRVKWVSPGL